MDRSIELNCSFRVVDRQNRLIRNKSHGRRGRERTNSRTANRRACVSNPCVNVPVCRPHLCWLRMPEKWSRDQFSADPPNWRCCVQADGGLKLDFEKVIENLHFFLFVMSFLTDKRKKRGRRRQTGKKGSGTRGNFVSSLSTPRLDRQQQQQLINRCVVCLHSTVVAILRKRKEEEATWSVTDRSSVHGRPVGLFVFFRRSKKIYLFKLESIDWSINCCILFLPLIRS